MSGLEYFGPLACELAALCGAHLAQHRDEPLDDDTQLLIRTVKDALDRVYLVSLLEEHP